MPPRTLQPSLRFRIHRNLRRAARWAVFFAIVRRLSAHKIELQVDSPSATLAKCCSRDTCFQIVMEKLIKPHLLKPMRVTITNTLFIALFITSVRVFADTLVVGSVYFDSLPTLNEVIKLSAQNDNAGIAKLIANGHVSNQTDAEINIMVLTSGSTSEDPAEFRFLNDPTTYWTLTKNVTTLSRPIPSSTPVATPTPTPEVTPPPTESLTPTSKDYRGKNETNSPFDDDNGQRIWHKVNGKWKWYPANKHHVLVKKPLPQDAAPTVKP